LSYASIQRQQIYLQYKSKAIFFLFIAVFVLL